MRRSDKIKKRLCLLALLIPMLSSAEVAPKTPDLDITKAKEAFIQDMVARYHCKPSMVKAVLAKAQYRAEVLARIKKPFEARPWYQYRQLFITDNRIKRGIAFWHQNQDILAFMQDQFNVPSKIIVGILGVETIYGQEMGKYKVLNTLTTLTFYYPQRTKFFQTQLAEFIMYCTRNHIKPSSILGSYAGAIGQPQFMPSTISAYAVDYKKKGMIDLMHNEGDVIASIANFLAKQGWQANAPIAILAKAKPGVDIQAVYTAHQGEKLTMDHWAKLGILPSMAYQSAKDHPLQARLMQMPLEKGQAYWLAFPNFDVIKHYNSSDNYALAVTVLGSLVQAGYTKQYGTP